MVANICRIGVQALKYGYRGLKAAPNLLFTENGAKELLKGARTGLQSGGTSREVLKATLKGAGKGLEGAAGQGLWTSVKTSAKALPGAVSRGWKLGGRAAAIAGKSPFLGKIFGAFKGVSKAIPGLGNIMMAAMSLPTIISAFKDEGIVGGVKETLKEGTKLGAGAIGAAIGSAFGPIGTAVGWVAGSWIASCFTGKSHSEKKAEQEEQLAQAQAQQQETVEQTQNPEYAYAQQPQFNPSLPNMPNPFMSNNGLDFSKLPPLPGMNDPFGNNNYQYPRMGFSAIG